MEESIETPGVEELTTPTVDTQLDTTPGETPVTTEEKPEKYVPLERFQEVNNKARDNEAKLLALEEKLAATFGATKEAEVENPFDESTSKNLDTWAKKNGFVSKAELEAQNATQRAQTDLTEIAQKEGLNTDEKEELGRFAKELGVRGRAGLEAAYKEKFFDRIIENKVKAALAEANKPKAVAEKPGAGGATAPVAEKPTGPMKLGDRIKAAHNRVTNN